MKVDKRHLLFWALYFCYCYLTDSIVDDDARLDVEIIFFITQNIYLFYSFYFSLKNFSAKSKPLLARSLLGLIIILGIYLIVRYIIRYRLLCLYNPAFGELSLKEWWVGSAIWVTNYFIFASAYFYFTTSVKKQKDLNKMREDRLVKEREKVELENTLLKAQINPHFLYNALNFLYAKSLTPSHELSESIMQLSEIMRYALKPFNEEGIVQLNTEVEHIHNVIGMAKLRYSNRVFIDFSVSGNTEHIAIIPFILITLVGNVLKHGAINQQESPATIILDVSKSHDIQFTTWNKKRIGPKEKSTNIGIINIIKRLEYAYGTGFKLNIKDQSESFGIVLTITLNPQLHAVA